MSVRMTAGAALMALALGAGAAWAGTVAELRGDFDGDGKPDRAAIETTAGGWRLVATAGGKTAILENQPGSPDGFYLKPAHPGRYGGVRVRHAAIEFGRDESGAQI